MVELSYFALFLLLTGCITAGVVAGVVHTWSLRALSFSLDTRLTMVEGILNREVKARAGQERWKKPSLIEAELLKNLSEPASAPTPKFNWWDNPALKKGAHHG